MSYRFVDVIDRYLLSSSEFSRKLRAVRPDHWTAATPAPSGMSGTSSTT
ncbi:hypothetical protein ACQ4WX_03055 [Streptomyces lasalocidi]